MIRFVGSIIYFSGLIFAEILRLPRRISRIREHRGRGSIRAPYRVSELCVITSILLGIWVLPITYTMTNWLRAFDYSLSPWIMWAALPVFIIGLVIRWKAQQTLAKQWSFTLETLDCHRLVKSGIYSYTRHPIYVSLILWAMAQPLLLQNFIAGLGGVISVILIWAIRVPLEEEMMIETFGEEYRQYMAHTGRFFSKKQDKIEPNGDIGNRKF